MRDVATATVERRYLLGVLGDDERRSLEERLFAEDAYLDLLEAAEDDLVDDYVRGSLGMDERARFESYFLSSQERREKLAFAEALLAHVDAAAAPAPRWSPPGWLAVAAAAVACVLIIACALLAARLRRAESQLEEARDREAALDAERGELARRLADAQRRADELASGPERGDDGGEQQPVTPRISSPIVALELAPGRLRGGTGTRVALGRGSSLRLLLLVPPGEIGPLDAAVSHVGGGAVFAKRGVAVNGGASPRATLLVPASALGPGDYVVRLDATDGEAAEAVAIYYFSVSPH